VSNVGRPGLRLSDFSGKAFLFVGLQVPDDESLPSGWSRHAKFTTTVVNQTDEKQNIRSAPRPAPIISAPTYDTFKAGWQGCGRNSFITLTALNDKSSGYIVNDTLIIQCDMNDISSNALLAAAAPAGAQRETRIVDADTAAAAVIIAAFPGALPAAAAAIAAINPAAITGAAPRVAVPAGLYPAGNGGLVYLYPGAQVNN